MLDVLYKIKLKKAYGYLYILIEDESNLDKFMAFRVLCYQRNIIERHLNTYGKKLPLPYVKMLVYYNKGKIKPNSFETDVSNLFGDLNIYENCILGNCSLKDINEKTILEIFENHKFLILLESLLKMDPDLDLMYKAFSIAQKIKLNEDTIYKSLRYLLGQIREDRIEDLNEKVINKLSKFFK